MSTLRKVRAALVLCAVACLLTLGAPRASADAFTSTLNSPNTAISPYPAPYGTVTVVLTSSTTADVTFTAGSSGGYTYLFIDNGAADVNVNASSFTATFDSLTSASTVYPSGGFQAASFNGFGSGNVDDQGSFNLTTNLFDGGDRPATVIKFTLTNTSGGTWASASDVLTPNALLNDAAAHIIVFSGTPVNTGTPPTGYVGETVPEPASMGLLGTALLGAYGLLRRKLGV